MKKVLLIVAILSSCLFAFNPTNIKGQSDLQTTMFTTCPVGTKCPVAINIAGGDAVITVPIRLITATSGTAIKVDIKAVNGTVTGVIIPPNLPVLNVTKIYKTGTDCTNILIWPLE